MFDVSTVLGSTAGAGAASTLGGFVIWFLFQRVIERQDKDVDSLRATVRDLETNRLSGIVATLDAHDRENDERFAAESKSRKDIHQTQTEILRTMVTRQECSDHHDKLATQLGDFNAATLRLERVSERGDLLMKRSEQLLEQVIGAQKDLAAVCARVDDINNRLK